MLRRVRQILLIPAVIAAIAAAGCGNGSSSSSPTVIRLVDAFKPEMVEGSATRAAALTPTEWRFTAGTAGWIAGRNVEGFGHREGRLTGRSATDFPILSVTRTRDLGNADQLHAVEIRMRVSAGSNVAFFARPAGPVDFALAEGAARGNPWQAVSPLLPGGELQTYRLISPIPVNMSRAHHLLVRPTDVAGATFEIESVRMITRREHLAAVDSGMGWHGLNDVFREALVSRAPETIRIPVDIPRGASLDLALGTMEDQPPTFRVAVTPENGEERIVLEQTVTTPNRWESQSIDLSEFGGRRASIALSLTCETPGTLGLWGTPAVRSKAAPTASKPRGVILIHADTLRPDHLGLYGHRRDTAPFLTKLAGQGALFRAAYAQGGWTKVSTASFMTSLYPSTHGVHRNVDQLPAAANTMAESYRANGYATVSFSSVMWTGAGTNMHQGFEELHERTSVSDDPGYGSKTARTYVDRAMAWLGERRDTPFFMYLHVFDPHSPFEPRRPYDALYADVSRREAHLAEREHLRKFIESGFLAFQGMATREEMLKARIDPAAYLAHERDWYDGSIRGLDAEMARLFERLRFLGLDRDVAVVFLSDHGEEFHEHGRMWHGQSVYGEMMHVPLMIRWPAGLPSRKVIGEPVQLVDVMPTLLELSGLPAPSGMQGRSLLPLLRDDREDRGDRDGASGRALKRRPVIMEKHPQGQPGFPGSAQSFAIIDGGWKLIHNTIRPPDRPEYELYEYPKDRFDSNNVAGRHPAVVERLAKALGGWRSKAAAARLKPDTETTKSLSAEELQRLRSLGYVR